MLCGGSLLFQRTASSRHLKKNQNQRTGQFPLLQKNSKNKEPLVLSIFKTLKEPSVFNKQL
jgi:hypothetical protein